MKQSFRSNQKYTISAPASGLMLQADGVGNGASIRLAQPTGAPDQLWQLKKEKKGLYRISSLSSGLCLDVIAAGTADGSWVHQWEYLGGDHQLWAIEEAGEDICKIKNSGKCLDIVGMNAVSGAPLQLWSDVDGENQHWVIRPVLSRRASAGKSGEKKADKPAGNPSKKAE